MKERPILMSAPMVRALLDGRKTQTRRALKPQPKPYGTFADHTIWRFAPDKQTSIEASANVAPLMWLPFCPFGTIGDQLWVRESFSALRIQGTGVSCKVAEADYVVFADRGQKYRSDGAYFPPLKEYLPGANANRKYSPSIHLPRWASRLTLKITDVRVERLNDISVEDAIVEGVEFRIPPGALTQNIEFPPDFATRTKAQQDAWIEGQARATYFARCHANANALRAFEALWKEINGPDSWQENPWVWAVSFEVIP